MIHNNNCNMAIHDLPDMYALSPRASGIHIRQIPMAMLQPLHVRLVGCTTYYFALSVFTVEDDGDVADNEVHHESLLKSKVLTKLKAKYIKVVNNIKKIIESKRFKVEDLIANMCLADDHYSVFATDDAFSKITTINELFLHINKYCTIFEYKLLEMFLESLDECGEAVKLLDDFTEELQRSVLKELDLMSESKDQLKPKIPMHGTCTLKIKYTGDQKCTLSTKNMVQRIVCECLKLHKLSIIFLGLEEGCVAFVYQISTAVKSYILQKCVTPNDLVLLALHDIKCLIVDDTEISAPLEFKAQVSVVQAYDSLCSVHTYNIIWHKNLIVIKFYSKAILLSLSTVVLNSFKFS